MGKPKCPYCSSTRVTILGSYDTRDVVVIQCLDCGRTAELDTEHETIPESSP